MRKLLVAGNWKMNLEREDALGLMRGLRDRLDASVFERVEVVVCPSFIWLYPAAEIFSGTPLGFGAQNLYFEERGAFTGEVSAPMLRSVGCGYVIVGHSERRSLFGETDGMIQRKILVALRHGLCPVVCVGETLFQREQNRTEEVLEAQIRECFSGLTLGQWGSCVIAYEPVWAIGTGRTATPEMAQQAHSFIRSLVAELAGEGCAKGVRILYGGSVKPGNAYGLAQKADIDGFLVGGASLKVEDFYEIILAGIRAKYV